MKKPKYFLSPSPNTCCPLCGSEVLMLATHDVEDAAAFYVCNQDGRMDPCRFIGQIGVGPVPEFEEVQLVPEPELTPEQESFYINAAREAYAKGSNDDVTVDDDARFSEVDNGVWVSGWLWIAKPLCEQCGEPYDASKGDPWAMCDACIGKVEQATKPDVLETTEEEEEDIEPPDLERCQANIRNGSFMSLGKPTVSRCKNKPTTVVKENEPGADGKCGSMALCDDCLTTFRRRFKEDYATITRINPVCGDCGNDAVDPIDVTSVADHGRCFDCHKNWQHGEHCSVESQNDPSIVGYQIAGNQYCTTCIEGVDFNELKDMGFELETPYPIKKGDPDWGVGSVPVCHKCNHEINTLEEDS